MRKTVYLAPDLRGGSFSPRGGHKGIRGKADARELGTSGCSPMIIRLNFTFLRPIFWGDRKKPAN